MSVLIEELKIRSGNMCELTGRTENLVVYQVPPTTQATPENCILICSDCLAQLEKQEQMDSEFWQVLSDTMWSEHLPVKIVIWRMLSRLKHESWASDCLDMLYLDEETLKLAKRTGDHENDQNIEFHEDTNGVRLHNGDSITLIKTLDVKGSSIAAKIGTVVKNIRLVNDNIEQIEGKIGGQTIVILTKYVRKNN